MDAGVAVEQDEKPVKSVFSARPYATNPLGIISLFVFLVEAVSTVSLIQMSKSDNTQVLGQIAPLVWFVICFPALIAAAFFIVLWNKHEVLYAPKDFADEEHFMESFNKMKITQKATILKSDADVSLYKDAILQLAKYGDVDLMVNVGRRLLDAKRYKDALTIFRLIDKKVDSKSDDYYRVLANTGYCLMGLGRDYGEIIELFLKVNEINKGNIEVWHMLALAFAYKKNGDETNYQSWLAKVKQRTDYAWWKEKARELYPEIAGDLN
jgi:tetratricopeptide (TPR) repeat protein